MERLRPSDSEPYLATTTCPNANDLGAFDPLQEIRQLRCAFSDRLQKFQESSDQSESQPVPLIREVPNRLTILERVNSGMVFLGFLAIAIGILGFLVLSGSSNRVGLSVAVTGLSLILIGLGGRTAQEFCNNRIERKRNLATDESVSPAAIA